MHRGGGVQLQTAGNRFDDDSIEAFRFPPCPLPNRAVDRIGDGTNRVLRAHNAGNVVALRRQCNGTVSIHLFGLGFGWRLKGAGGGGFEIRFEGSRVEPANEPGEHRAGFRVAARW